MDDVKGGRRPYHSPTREGSAHVTRERVLAAAEQLFVERGYALASIEQIAERAGVSRQTVFTSVGSKVVLLSELRDRALAGDEEPAPVSERAWFLALLADPEPAGVLRRYAEGVADIGRRYARLEEVLQPAAGSNEELRELWEANETQRYAGATAVACDLARKGELRHDLGTSCDLLWLLTSPQHYLRLVHRRGWSHDQYRDWITSSLREQLLRERP